MTYRIVVIEPSEIIQAGLKVALEGNAQWQIVATLNDTQRIEERLAPLRADVVIINPTLVEYHLRAQICEQFADDTVVLALVNGYMDSNIGEQFAGMIDIFEPICRIEQRLTEALDKKRGATPSKFAKDLYELTDREKDILVAAVKGLTNKEISVQLNISIHTVISHRKNISRKTEIKSLSGLTVYALLNGLIEHNQIH